MEDKEQITDVNNTGNLPREYTLDDTVLGMVKIQPQEDSIRLLKGLTRTMAGRSTQTVNNLPADMSMDKVKGAKQRHKQYR